MLKLKYILLGSITLSIIYAFTSGLTEGNDEPIVPIPPTPVFADADGQWADSVFNQMTLDERIGQLFMIAAYSNKGAEHKNATMKLVKDYHIGGLIFFQGGPLRQARLTNDYQDAAKIPLFIAMDAEWGLGMRLDSVISYPRQMALGAIQDDSAIYQMGLDIAAQCKRLGVHISFSPDADVNNNPNNPVIGSRSFGEDVDNVGRKAVAYSNGLQDGNVLAVGKHFPGHGDTDKDSHKSLPVIPYGYDRLSQIELPPFEDLIQNRVGGMMVAHLEMPGIDSVKGRPASLSPVLVKELLKDSLGFRGLVFTDALNMKGITSGHEPVEANLMALLAGNDVLLYPKNIPAAIDLIKTSIADSTLDVELVNRACYKILKAKEWAGLNEMKPIVIDGLYEDLNAADYLVKLNSLVEQSLTVVSEKENALPIQPLIDSKTALVQIGKATPAFEKQLEAYVGQPTVVKLPKSPTADQWNKALKELEQAEDIHVVYTGLSNRASKNYNVDGAFTKKLSDLAANKKVYLHLLGLPYVVNQFDQPSRYTAITIGYTDWDIVQELMVQMVYGANAASGKTSVSSDYYPVNTGFDIAPNQTMGYAVPEKFGIPSQAFDGIDKIAMRGVLEKAYPGCQVLVAYKGDVIYNKNFGYQTYAKKKAISSQSVYDLASITKISSTLAAVMQLQDRGEIQLSDTLGKFFPVELKGSELATVTIQEMLAHQAGLKDWIPFYLKTIKSDSVKNEIYQADSSSTYAYKVAEDMYINVAYKDSIYSRIIATPLNHRGDYKYSDLGYYFLQKIVEQESGETLDEYVATNFYIPMGLASMGYHPKYRRDMAYIVPTENDTKFRMQLIQGDVHDQGAAMMGGVGGHAGVFANANDLAKMMQMYLQNGYYGGHQYLTPATLRQYERCQFCDGTKEQNRRGAGFDKPVTHGDGGPTCQCASMASFGHSGFTGTLTWVDPQYDLVYVFLSNRIYPSEENRKLIRMNIRTDIMQEIYNAIELVQLPEDSLAQK